MESDKIPTSGLQRIETLDVLRGFALLGILSVNIVSFSMPSAAYFNPTVYGDFSGLNAWVWRLTHIFSDLKFMAIFAMLFGAGIVLMSERNEARGVGAAAIHYRRMFWLIVFGLLHAHLLWYGDILYWYGMCGMVVFLFKKLSPIWLIACGLLSLSVASGLMMITGLSVGYWPPEELAIMVDSLDPPASIIAEELAAYQSGWLQQMPFRSAEALEMETSTFLFWAFWRVSGLMLVGMGLFKLGVLSARASSRVYTIFLILALVVGIPLILYGVRYNIAIDWRAPDFFFLGLQFNYWGSLLVSLGWVSLLLLLYRKWELSSWLRPLAAVGQTAFSNYILQTLICTTIFYGHGFGLFGQVERSEQILVVLGVWALQLLTSPLWLKHFRFGPLEWIWRSLVYMKRPVFRRVN